MKIPFLRRQVRTRASYTDAVTELLLRQASGADAVVSQVAAAEFAVGLVSRCMSVAELDPPIPAVTPAYLAAVGRALMLRGNHVSAMRVTSRGLTLLPSNGFDVVGSADPSTWFYTLQLPGPTRQEAMTVAEGGVVHHRVNADGARPWIGQSALTHAGLSSSLVANLELRMGEEAASRAGYLLQTPELAEDQLQELKSDLGSMKGGIGLVRSGSNSYDPRGQVGNGDWRSARFGADLPEGNISARRDAGMDLVAAMGIPSGLYSGGATGTGLQEAYRQFSTAMLEPLGELVAAELRDKLDVPNLVLRFDKVAASDVVRRATAFQRLRDSGVLEDDARRIAGVR